MKAHYEPISFDTMMIKDSVYSVASTVVRGRNRSLASATN